MTDAISSRDRSLQALHEQGMDDANSGQVMAKIAGDAGVQQMAIKGNDKTYDELVAEFKGDGKATVAEVGVHATEVAVFAGEHALEHAAGAMAAAGVDGVVEAGSLCVEVFGPVAVVGLGAYEIAKANVEGKELQKALARDEEHVALLTHLELPKSFVQSELAKYPQMADSSMRDSPHQKMTTWMAGQDRALVLALQTQCDRGMHAANDLKASGLSQGAFLAANPNVARRYANDAAFKAGFDASIKTTDPKEVAIMNLGLEYRDASYARAQISMRA